MTLTYLTPRHAVSDADRQGVIEDFPEIALIEDPALRTALVEAWALSLCHSGFHRITEHPPGGNPSSPVLRRGTQADHLRGVVRLAIALARELETAWPEARINWPALITGAVCHDVGKPYEFDAANRECWAVSSGLGTLTLNADLRLSATAFRVGAGLFFLGYMLCEVRSNLLLARFGARDGQRRRFRADQQVGSTGGFVGPALSVGCETLPGRSATSFSSWPSC